MRWAAGVVVLFADERLLSSDPNNWDQFVREAHEAEAYSRKLSKRVGEGYAAKRRCLGVPGGNRAPYGIIREGKPSTLRIDEAKGGDGSSRVRARHHRTDGLGGRGRYRPCEDPRWRGAHEPDLRRASPHHDRPALRDEVTFARIGREREEASRRLAKTRDVSAWQREMAQLDAEEQAAHEPVEAGRLSSGEVVEYLRSLPALWSEAGPDGRQALATGIFVRTDITGLERLEYELTSDAIELGLDAALPAVFELGCTIAEFGRGERI